MVRPSNGDEIVRFQGTSAMPDNVILEVARFSPESDTQPRFETFEVPYRPDWMVLDALNHIKDQIDGSLTFRWSCRMGICGSCGMMINGREWLACEKRISDFASMGPIQVAPLQHFPVIRDLVIDMTDFLEKLEKTRPWLIRDKDTFPQEEFRQNPTAAQNVQTVQYVHQLHAVLFSLPGLRHRRDLRRACDDRPCAALEYGFA
jgi:succinate dehydrogenase/fumarate reductase iron-sulfur protein